MQLEPSQVQAATGKAPQLVVLASEEQSAIGRYYRNETTYHFSASSLPPPPSSSVLYVFSDCNFKTHQNIKILISKAEFVEYDAVDEGKLCRDNDII